MFTLRIGFNVVAAKFIETIHQVLLKSPLSSVPNLRFRNVTREAKYNNYKFLYISSFLHHFRAASPPKQGKLEL
jgi:hypothetical protein